MSERIYAWLLQLYPSHFREAYGGEAQQLFRDRVRDEKGFFSCLRLWLDLIVDLAISIPREYGYAQAAPFGASVPQRLNNVPVFYVLEGGSPRPGAMLFGSVLSCLALAIFWLSLSHAGNYVGLGIVATGQLQNDSKFFQHEAPQTYRQDAITATNPAEVFRLDAVERQRVIDAAVVILKKHYIEHENARKMADALLAHAKSGDDDAVTDGAAFPLC